MGVVTALIAIAVVSPVQHFKNCSLSIYNLFFLNTRARKLFFFFLFFLSEQNSNLEKKYSFHELWFREILEALSMRKKKNKKPKYTSFTRITAILKFG